MVLVYALYLENERYYIGSIHYAEKSLSNWDMLCNLKDGGDWIVLNRPLKVVECIPESDGFVQDKVTLMYMHRYGIENVRGGSFSNFVLDPSQIQTAKRMIRHANNQCYTCGRKDHHQKECSEEKWRQLRDRCFQCGDMAVHSYKDCPNKNVDKLYLYSKYQLPLLQKNDYFTNKEEDDTFILKKHDDGHANHTLQNVLDAIRKLF
jgi:hypothetical protein